MTLWDLLRFTGRSLMGHRLRTALSLVGVTIGVAAVVILTALGEGARRYVIDQFASLGTNLLIVMPGRTETTGAVPTGGVPNDLTLYDAQAVARAIPEVRRAAPIVVATESVAFRERRREVMILGTTAEYQEVRQLVMGRGHFLPPGEMFRGSTVVVLGARAARELFGEEEAVGQVVRIGDWRMRVSGVLASQGVKMGLDFDDIAIVPVSTAMKMFNRRSLFRLVIQGWAHTDLLSIRRRVLDLLTERHGEEDVSVVTQDAVLSTFSAILGALTLAIGAIGAISLSVAGIGIMNVMLVSVSERTREIGLLKAVGAGRPQILLIFLGEATAVSLAGGLIGLAVGWLLVQGLVGLYPALPARPPEWAVAAAVLLSLLVGIGFGVLPARRATLLDPVAALGGR